ncbi:MAG: hypothetical protein WAS21_01755 [Geminicoccaceae bacterium]
MTARHVVRPQERNGRSIYACWWYTKDTQCKGFVPLADDAILWESDDYDVAVLKCQQPADMHGWLRPSDQRPADGMRWSSEGFPQAHVIDKARTPGSFGGHVYSRADGERYFEVEAETRPGEIEDWGGASGMPLVVDDKVLGVFVQVPPRIEGKLQAAPLWKLLTDESFRHAIGLEGWTQHQAAFQHLIVRKLNGQSGLLQALARCLTGAAQTAAQNGNVADFANRILAIPLRQMLKALRSAHKTLEVSDISAAQALSNLVGVIAPALCDYAVLEFMRDGATSPDLALLELPAGTRSMAELLMAAYERREASFCARASEGELPMGKRCLPLFPPVGIDIDGSRAAEAICQDIEAQMAPFLGTLANYLENDLGMFRPEPGAPSRDAEERRRFVQQRMRSDREDGEPGYYMVVHLPPADSNLSPVEKSYRRYMEQVMSKVRNRYPELLCLAIDAKRELEDLDALDPLRRMLPIVRSIQ